MADPDDAMQSLKIRLRIVFDVCTVYLVGALFLIKQLVTRNSKTKDFVLHGPKIAVITGGSSGIGAKMVNSLLEMKMKVIVGCLNAENVEEVMSAEFRDNVEYLHLDLSSMKSIQKFSAKVSQKYDTIDLLIHNAGVMFEPFCQTEDGFEQQCCVNYIGPVLLTILLFPYLQKHGVARASSKVVFVSSCEHLAVFAVPSNFDNLRCEKHYSSHGAYACSKLFQILFSYSFNRFLKSREFPVQVLSLHPGIVNTNLYKNVRWTRFVPFLLRILFLTPEQGALNVLGAIYGKETVDKSGFYWSDGQICKSSRLSYDLTLQQKLWQATIKVLKPWIPRQSVFHQC